MPRCIYCRRTDAVFTTPGEHVMPKYLGVFVPDLTLGPDLVCEECNNGFLSKIDEEFSSDSPEGYFANKLLLKPTRVSTRLKGQRFKLKIETGGLGDAFAEVFPLWDHVANQWCLVPTVVMHDKAGAPVRLRVETLAKLATRPQSKEFRKKKKLLGELSAKGMSVVGDEQTSVEEIAQTLKTFGVEYQEKTREHVQPNQHISFTESFEMAWDQDILRLPAKIAFHYFAYCAKESGYRDMLFGDAFNKLRDYLMGMEPILPVTMRQGGFVNLPEMPPGEPGDAGPMPIHGVAFYEEGGRIMGRVSLLNWFTYEMELGTYPFSNLIPRKRFGSGHAFLIPKKEVRPIFVSRTPILRTKPFSLFGS